MGPAPGAARALGLAPVANLARRITRALAAGHRRLLPRGPRLPMSALRHARQLHAVAASGSRRCRTAAARAAARADSELEHESVIIVSHLPQTCGRQREVRSTGNTSCEKKERRHTNGVNHTQGSRRSNRRRVLIVGGARRRTARVRASRSRRQAHSTAAGPFNEANTPASPGAVPWLVRQHERLIIEPLAVREPRHDSLPFVGLGGWLISALLAPVMATEAARRCSPANAGRRTHP